MLFLTEVILEAYLGTFHQAKVSLCLKKVIRIYLVICSLHILVFYCAVQCAFTHSFIVQELIKKLQISE